MGARQRIIGGAAAAFSLLLAAAAPATASDGVVRILIPTDLNSIYAEMGGQGSVTAAEMAVEAVGRKVAGMPVKIVVRDTELTPEKAVSEAQAENAEQPIDMITGQLASNVGLALQKWATQNNVVILHNGPSSTAFTNESCSPVGIQWGFDTYATTSASVTASVAEGNKRWFFITADYSFGHNLEEQGANFVKRSGGEVVGNAVAPYPGVDFSSELQEALISGADVIGLANAGEDTQRTIRQGYELGVGQAGMKMLAMEFYITDIRRLGLYVTSGLQYATSFYWNENAQTRAWSKRYEQRTGAMPTTIQAGVYSATLHYLEAVRAAGTDDTDAVLAQMRKRPVDDGVFATNGHIRPDGRMVSDMILVQVKSPSDSKGAWDYVDVVRTIPGKKAFKPMAQGDCPLVAGK